MESQRDILTYDPIIIPERIFNRYIALWGLAKGRFSLRESFALFFFSAKERSVEVTIKREEAKVAYWRKSINGFVNNDGSVNLFSQRFYTTSENYGELIGLLKEVITYDQYAVGQFVKDGNTIVDAGANIGTFSIRVAHSFPHAKIYAFEPSARTFAILKKNTASYPNIICINRGLGNAETQKNMAQPKFGAGGGRLEDSPMGPLATWENLISETVTVTTLDAAMQEKVDFIKMDTEGYEMKILQGATKTIQKNKPVIAMSAYHNPGDKEELPKLLKSIYPKYVCELRQTYEEDFICYVPQGQA